LFWHQAVAYGQLAQHVVQDAAVEILISLAVSMRHSAVKVKLGHPCG
jgi:hypothetical protein